MSIPIIAFFNNKGGVGKTSLVFHLAWMYSDMGLRVVAADLDPQANLTAAFLEEEKLEAIWLSQNESSKTIFGCIRPLIDRTGDISSPYLELVDDNLALLLGDLYLSKFEDLVSSEWSKCLEGDVGAFRVITAFWRVMQTAASIHNADLILMDLGPNLGALNRSALISADYVVIPLSPDLFSLQGLKNLGPTFGDWKQGWELRKPIAPNSFNELPDGNMIPLGYVVLQHSLRLDRPAVYYSKWIDRIPDTYREYVLNTTRPKGEREDKYRLALMRHYRSLMPMAQEARKPIFHLQSADGAIGSHADAVNEARNDFRKLAHKIIKEAEI